jgi:hypothetical protein
MRSQVEYYGRFSLILPLEGALRDKIDKMHWHLISSFRRFNTNGYIAQVLEPTAKGKQSNFTNY